ncbi:MAG TPA: hypothetical protein VN894_12665 [Polyangiaceae bacterium]|nr:hypothetical protein [Polyangiaceae bacterium]
MSVGIAGPVVMLTQRADLVPHVPPKGLRRAPLIGDNISFPMGDDEQRPLTRVRVFGGLAREASVLIFVFGMLDIFFHEPEIPASVPLPSWAAPALELVLDLHTRRIYVLPWALLVCLSSGLTLLVGMRCEFPKAAKSEGGQQ